jgi:hypothetical protein
MAHLDVPVDARVPMAEEFCVTLRLLLSSG